MRHLNLILPQCIALILSTCHSNDYELGISTLVIKLCYSTTATAIDVAHTAGMEDIELLRELNRSINDTLDCTSSKAQDASGAHKQRDAGNSGGCKPRAATLHQKRQRLILEYRLRCKMGIVVAVQRLQAIDRSEEI